MLALSSTLGMLYGVAGGSAAADVSETPQNTSPPRLTGSPRPGHTLTCLPGDWAPQPTSYAYAWLVDDRSILGQISPTFVVQREDGGRLITCRVIAERGGGEYVLPDLPTGSYRLEFGVENLDFHYAQLFAGATAGQVTTGDDIALAQSGEIAGRVTYSGTERPIADVEVDAQTRTKSPGGHDMTNRNGEYLITGVQSGAYVISFNCSTAARSGCLSQFYPHASSERDALPVGVAADGRATVVNGQVPRGGMITGRVTSAAGAPISNVVVHAGLGFGVTNANGEYHIAGLTGGSYTVSFAPEPALSNFLGQYYPGKSEAQEARPVRVTQRGKPTRGINATLAVAGEIAGRVTSASTGAPLPGIKAYALSATDRTDRGDGQPPYVTTNENGEYVIPGLGTGLYNTYFKVDDGTVNYLGQAFPGEVKVTAGAPATSQINAALLPGGEISGRVTSALNGAPLAGAEIQAVGTTGSGYVTTNTSGEYLVKGIPSGEYKITFSPSGAEGSYLGQYYRDRAAYAEADAVEVVAGGPVTADVNAALLPGGEITGKVTSAESGAPLAGAYVSDYELANGFILGPNSGRTRAGARSPAVTSKAVRVPVGRPARPRGPMP